MLHHFLPDSSINIQSSPQSDSAITTSNTASAAAAATSTGKHCTRKFLKTKSM